MAPHSVRLAGCKASASQAELRLAPYQMGAHSLADSRCFAIRYSSPGVFASGALGSRIRRRLLAYAPLNLQLFPLAPDPR
jgi:hypothetical protein